MLSIVTGIRCKISLSMTVHASDSSNELQYEREKRLAIRSRRFQLLDPNRRSNNEKISIF